MLYMESSHETNYRIKKDYVLTLLRIKVSGKQLEFSPLRQLYDLPLESNTGLFWLFQLFPLSSSRTKQTSVAQE